MGNGKDSSGDDDDDIESSLPNDPETCLEMNLVYQNIIQEKINEVADLIAQNKGQQVGAAESSLPRRRSRGVARGRFGWSRDQV